MNNSLKKKKDLKKILILIFITALLFFLLNFYQKEVKNFFYSISSPFQKTLWRMGDEIADFFAGISEAAKTKKENENLKSENQKILAENLALKELKRENEVLREALRIGMEKDFNLILCQVIGKDISQDSLTIDKGLKDGIRKNLPVITEQKTLVGKIGEVYEDFSEVILISNKKISFDGEISDTETYGIVKGKGSFNLLFDFLPKEKEIKQGDLVVTSALGGIFPKGLLVGEIKKVEKSDVEPFQWAEISPSFDVKRMDNLFIIFNF